MTRRFIGGRELDALLSPPDEDLVAVPLDLGDLRRRAEPHHDGTRNRDERLPTAIPQGRHYGDGCDVAASCFDCPLLECKYVTEDAGREGGDSTAEGQSEKVTWVTDHRIAKQGPCTVEGCEKPMAARGLCHAHWRRLRRHGHPLGDAWTSLKRLARLQREMGSLLKPQHDAGDNLAAFREAEARNGTDWQGSNRTAEELGIDLGEVFRLRGRVQVLDGEV